MTAHSSSRAGRGDFNRDERREKHPLRDKLIVAIISALLTAGAIGIYFQSNNINISSGSERIVTITQPGGSTETVTWTTTFTDTTEINRLNQQITNMQNEINQLNQQVSSLTPVSVYGTANLTGWFNSLGRIEFASQGITYSVTIKDGYFQIYLPRGQIYQVSLSGTGWFGLPWDVPPSQPSSAQLNLGGYLYQTMHESYVVNR